MALRTPFFRLCGLVAIRGQYYAQIPLATYSFAREGGTQSLGILGLWHQLRVTLPVARSYTAAWTFSLPDLMASLITVEELRSKSA